MVNNLLRQLADYSKGPTSLGKRNADTSSSKKVKQNPIEQVKLLRYQHQH